MILVANLDCELEMARAEGHRGNILPAGALRAAAALGTLMRVLGETGDRLWTILPVDPDRVVATEGIPTPELVSGPIPSEPTLAWGGTGAIDRRVNDREFSLRLAKAHGWSLPGAEILHSLWAAERKLGDEDRFVLKQPFSAAGRSRVIGRGPIEVARASRLLIEQDRLIFEPWVDRIEDFSVTGFIGEAGPEEIEIHRLINDGYGRFRGIGIEADFEPPDVLIDAAVVAGRAVHAEGYRGPFSIDAFTYRDAGGEEAICPLVEINARWSFGLIARRFAAQLGHSRMTLRTGTDLPDGATPLLLPGDEDRTTAWIEIG